jgi:oligosaccharide repeat unit polymerase
MRRKGVQWLIFYYLKSRNFPIHLLCYWWILWLSLSLTDLNEYLPPSMETMAQYVLLLVSFLAGYLVVKGHNRRGLMATKPAAFRSGSARVKLVVYMSAFGSTLLLLISLKLSGAFTYDFIEYFTRLRVGESGLDTLTGIHYLDVLTKILAFPLSYTVILVILSIEIRHFKLALLACIFNLLCFSYLWQVNYPLIHMFWFLVFYLLILGHRRSQFDRKTMMIIFVLFATLLASAANRFGGDVLGGLERYIVGYHLLGFSYYDYQYNDPQSILHSLSYGRSSLGFLDQMLETSLKFIGVVYNAASVENSTYNDQAVNIGLNEIREVNAFGTILFTLYRDFHLIGIMLGGFLYGAVVTHVLYRSAQSWICGALFLFLASSWMMGMMVSPLEQAYFWFAAVALGLFGLVNRGIKL